MTYKETLERFGFNTMSHRTVYRNPYTAYQHLTFNHQKPDFRYGADGDSPVSVAYTEDRRCFLWDGLTLKEVMPEGHLRWVLTSDLEPYREIENNRDEWSRWSPYKPEWFDYAQPLDPHNH